MLSVLLVVVLAVGCCSEPAKRIRPTLPPGKPQDLRSHLLELEAGWRDSGAIVVLPAEDLELVLADRLAWQAWARALEAAGGWVH